VNMWQGNVTVQTTLILRSIALTVPRLVYVAVVYTAQRQVVGLVNSERERIWKEPVVA
jgi:hypothetical protein